MPHESPLPWQWKSLEGLVRYVQQVGATEYHSTCPKCGGDVHSNGEWPDRCILFTDDHPTLFCRRCGYMEFPDKLDGYKPPTPDELAARCRELRLREEARKRSAERALDNLRSSNLVQRYHEALDEYARRYWVNRGVPPQYQDWWQLGWAHQHEFFVGGHTLIADAATIPLFDTAWKPLNIKMRLEPAPPEGKYRYLISGQGEPLFRCDPDKALDGQHVIAVEGEIKSMVTFARLDDTGACMVGMPGCSPSSEVIAALATAERVTLVLDPGAKAQGVKIARAIGLSKCRLLETAEKIDDAIVSKEMCARDVQHWLDGAVKVSLFVNEVNAVNARAA